MKQKKSFPIIAVIVVAGVIASAFYFYYKQNPSDEIKSQWISSGPFAIDKSQYKLGENIFFAVHNLKPNEAGYIVIIRPDGTIWTTIPFNGTLKSNFNTYVKPDTSALKKIYEPEDLVGNWNVVFQGVMYKPLSFEIVNEFIPGAEADIVPIPRPINSTG